MTVIDMGKHLSQYGVQISDVSPKQLLAEVMEELRERIALVERPEDAILVGERVYRAMVGRLEEWTPEGELVPHSPDLSVRGIRVYVFQDEEERMSLRWCLWQAGKKILEVVE